jgi:phosphatidylglycerophosphatase A
MAKEPVCERCVIKGRWPTFFATGFGIGTMPMAPGTFGTLAAVPIYLGFSQASPVLYIELTILMFVIGVPLCQTAVGILGREDHPAIVWDEFVGYLITMTGAPQGWHWVIAGFLLFRLFDIWKPFPIRQIERRVKGGPGTMIDDVLAGLYALACMQALVWLNVRFEFI